MYRRQGRGEGAPLRTTQWRNNEKKDPEAIQVSGSFYLCPILREES